MLLPHRFTSTPADFASNPLQVRSLEWNLNSMLTYCYPKYTQLKSCTEKDNQIETLFPFSCSLAMEDPKKLFLLPLCVTYCAFLCSFSCSLRTQKAQIPREREAPATFLSALPHFNICNGKHQTGAAAPPLTGLTSQVQHSGFSDILLVIHILVATCSPQ